MKFLYVVLVNTLFLFSLAIQANAQEASISGVVSSANAPLGGVTVSITAAGVSTKTDDTGKYHFGVPEGNHVVVFTSVGYHKQQIKISLKAGEALSRNISLKENVSYLDEVVVTGVSRATQVRRNPVPIAVISQRTINQNVSTNVIDAIAKGIPGVSTVTTGPNISKPFIRGLGYNRVLTLFDGLRQEGQQWGDEHGIEIDQNGIARAEVVKGPASLAYGSDAVAGVINMIPQTPKFNDKRFRGDLTTDYHTNNGMIGLSLGTDFKANDWNYTARVSNRMAHNYRNSVDGYVYGTAFSELNISAFARVAKPWGNSQFAATLYNNKQEIPDGSRDSLTRRFTRQIGDAEDDIKSRPLVPNNELNTYSLNPLIQHIQHFRLYNSSNFKLGGGNLSVLLGGQQSVRTEYIHPTAISEPGLFLILNTLNYDAKYNFSEKIGFEGTVGINGMYQVNRNKDATDFAIPDYNLFDFGVFVFAKKTLGKFDISGGLRLDNRNVTWNDFYVGTDPITGFGRKAAPGTAGAELQFPRFEKSYQGLSGSAGVTYNLTERIVLKGNVARGYRAPNIPEIGSNGLDPGAHIVYLGNRTFKPEFNLQEDLGVIAYMEHFDLSVEVFNNDIQNYIYQSKLTDDNGRPVVIVPGNSTYQFQQSKARLYGAEFMLNLHPANLKWLSINNSVAYVKGLNKNQRLLDLYGDQAKYLPFIPPIHARSELKLTSQATKGLLSKPYFRIDLDAYADQDQFYALDNTETFTPGYTLWNLGLGTNIQRTGSTPSLEIFFNVQNLFNTVYQSNLNRLKYFEYYSASPNGRQGIYNMGRNFSFKIIKTF